MGDREGSPFVGSVRWTEVFESIERDAFEGLAPLASDVSRTPIAPVTLVGCPVEMDAP